MNIVVSGLNHNSAAIDIREKLAFSAADTIKALKELKSRFSDAEFVVLSTCNRVEIYSVSGSSEDMSGLDGEELAKFLSRFHNLALDDFQEFLYVHRDADAVRHLLTVASSLDSMVVGESQIIAQIKESYHLGCMEKSTGKILNHLFHCAFATGKKVHTSTSISSGRVSVAGVAVELAMQLFADISPAKILVIGAGGTGQLLVQHLLHIGCKDITVVNRSHEHALDMANCYGIGWQKWEELHEQLIDADIVIAAAAVQDYLFDKDSFSKIVDRRRGALLIIDIAVPRNFAPAINELKDVQLYSIDDLSDVVKQNQKARKEDIAKGMQIVDKSVSDFMDWFRARDIGPLIGQMREKFAQISQKELEAFFVGVRKDASCRPLTESMMKRVVNRLLHCVIQNVDVVARKHGPTEAAKLINGIVQNAEEISSSLDNKENTKS